MTAPTSTAADRWREALASWRIPDEILAQASTSPWIHPVALFRVDDTAAPDTPSRRIALEAVEAAGPDAVVLDVGCGGGRAAFAVAPPARHVVGVDHQQGMLDTFAQTAGVRGLAHTEILGDWPDVTASTPQADVVLCHHVAYNVAALTPFVTALDAHARRRVVLELPQQHPLAHLAPLWRHFWSLERPDGPTAAEALDVVREAGLDAHLVEWEHDPAQSAGDRGGVPTAQDVEFMRIRLCLTADRDAELAEVMASRPVVPRRLATLWWDVSR